jgi:hypothetical protein
MVAEDLYIGSVVIFDISNVEKGLNGIDGEKSARPDGVPPIFLKNCAVALAILISFLFYESLRKGRFPVLGKAAASPQYSKRVTKRIFKTTDLSVSLTLFQSCLNHLFCLSLCLI